MLDSARSPQVFPGADPLSGVPSRSPTSWPGLMAGPPHQAEAPASVLQVVREGDGRLRGLLAANRAVSANLTLHEVLAQIVESARQLLGSTYAAIGVLAEGGGLAQFIHCGIEDRDADRIGALPCGRGLLGLVIDHRRNLRLPDLTRHPAATGFPDHHPPMRSFIGVPIRIRDTVFGNLYLADKRDGAGFSAQDENLLVALAATAAVAIDHARQFEDSARRHQSHQATARITAALLGAGDEREILLSVGAECRLLVEADQVRITRTTAAGPEALEPPLPGAGALWVSCVLPDPVHLPGALIEAALTVGPTAGEVLVLTRDDGRPPFTAQEHQTVTTFCEQVALSLGRARVRADSDRVARTREHDRIARDIHDHVIGRLIGSGMAVQGLARWITDPAGQRKLALHLDDLDAAVRDVRTLVYGLDRDPSEVWSLRARIQQTLDESQAHLGLVPTADIDPGVELPFSSAAAGHLLAVLREALTNIARHAAARHVHVVVTGGDVVTLTVTDDGRGMPARSAAPSVAGGHGLANIADRAAEVGGSCAYRPNPAGGTILCWSTPTPR